MSTYDFHGNAGGPGGFGDHGPAGSGDGAGPGAVLRLAEQLVERLRSESPALVGQGEIVRDELTQAAPDGRGANMARVRFALDEISVGVHASSGALELTQRLNRVLGL